MMMADQMVHRPGEHFSFSRITWLVVACLVLVCVPSLLPAQQPLPKIDTETLKKLSAETADIERLIIRATPASLADARSRITTSLAMPAPDRAALQAIILGIERTVYGQNQSRFEIPASAEGADKKYITCLVAMSDVVAGKIPAILSGEPASALAELIGMLPFFSSTKAEIRAQAVAAASRFGAFGVVSIIPNLIAGTDALDSKRLLDAERYFSAALAIDRTVELAICGYAQAELALG
ncbi:MAG: hypothetical protein N3A02_07435, partial [Rectinema sp.]|nr:hypothetical protein [Rectinema sp.]